MCLVYKEYRPPLSGGLLNLGITMKPTTIPYMLGKLFGYLFVAGCFVLGAYAFALGLMRIFTDVTY